MFITLVLRHRCMYPAIVLGLSILAIFSSCRKLDAENMDAKNSTALSLSAARVNSESTSSTPYNCGNTVCEDCAFQEVAGSDTVRQATILGDPYVNPYSIDVMTQAHNIVYHANALTVSTTHYYVKFKPQTEDDVDFLDSLGVDLFDYPLDRKVIQEGQYWPAAYSNLTNNELPWVYAVVESNFQFPAGISYSILSPLHIPDNDQALEREAYRLTGNAEDYECDEAPQLRQSSVQSSNTQPCEEQVCLEGYQFDPSVCGCVPIPQECSPGAWWNGTACVPFQPSAGYVPDGHLDFNIYDDDGVAPHYLPVKNVRVVGRRFFKVARTYSDGNGNYSFSKSFPRKVTIVVHFKLSPTAKRHVVKEGETGLAIWNSIFALKKNIGTYKGKDLRNLTYHFEKSPDTRSYATRYWIACIALNTIAETNAFLATNNLGVIDYKIKVVLLNPNRQHGGVNNPTYQFIYESIPERKNIKLAWTNNDMNSMTASKVTINVAQNVGVIHLEQLCAAIHTFAYNKSIEQGVGGSNPPFGPGQIMAGTYYYPQLVALWQAFAQHLGHTIADRVFASGQADFELQGKNWASSGGVSSSKKYLELFDPSISAPAEKFPWIPVGLINDLMDSSPDPFWVVDNVSGFTYAEIKSAIQNVSSYTEMADFKALLKAIKPAQGVQIDQLFASYGY